MKNEKQILELVKSSGWSYISEHEELSEEFMEKHWNDLNYSCIFRYQKLSEEFMEKHWNDLNYTCISKYQKLSEEFMEKHWNDLNHGCISRYQKLSEEFMEKHWNDLDYYCISEYQKLSEEFIEKHNLNIPENNWLYITNEEKLEYIKKHTNYKIISDKYIIAYKSVRSDYYSVFNFQYRYDVGTIHESHCDCNLDNENSFGISAWTRDGALDYYNKGKLLKVKINIEDIGAIVHNNKIRCFRLEILKEVRK